MSSFSAQKEVVGKDGRRFLPLKISLVAVAAVLFYFGYAMAKRYRAAVVRVDSVKESKEAMVGIEKHLKDTVVSKNVRVLWGGLKTSPAYENINPGKGWTLFREARGYIGDRHVLSWLIAANYRADGEIENYIVELASAAPDTHTSVEDGPTAYGVAPHAKETIARDPWLRDKTNFSVYAYPFDQPKNFRVTGQIIFDRATVHAIMEKSTKGR